MTLRGDRNDCKASMKKLLLKRARKCCTNYYIRFNRLGFLDSNEDNGFSYSCNVDYICSFE